MYHLFLTYTYIWTLSLPLSLSLSLSLSYLISYTNTWMDIHCMNLTDKLSFYIPQMIYIGRYISSTRHDKLTTHVSTFAHSIYLYLIKSMYLLQTLNVSAPHTQCMSHTLNVCLTHSMYVSHTLCMSSTHAPTHLFVFLHFALGFI